MQKAPLVYISTCASRSPLYNSHLVDSPPLEPVSFPTSQWEVATFQGTRLEGLHCLFDEQVVHTHMHTHLRYHMLEERSLISNRRGI